MHDYFSKLRVHHPDCSAVHSLLFTLYFWKSCAELWCWVATLRTRLERLVILVCNGFGQRSELFRLSDSCCEHVWGSWALRASIQFCSSSGLVFVDGAPINSMFVTSPLARRVIIQAKNGAGKFGRLMMVPWWPYRYLHLMLIGYVRWLKGRFPT